MNNDEKAELYSELACMVREVANDRSNPYIGPEARSAFAVLAEKLKVKSEKLQETLE